jgi:ABC-2 type transport system permease protein
MSMMQGRGENAGASLHFEVFAKHISLVNFIMILATAALTMRLLAEEKKNRTYDLLMTSPVNATQIVLGKLLAGIGAAWALVFVSALYPISLRAFAAFDWGPLFAAYLGLLLVTASYVAVGLFASSLTESAVLAVVMSLIFSVAIWFVGAGAEASDNHVISKIFEHLSVGTHFVAFIRGGIGTASLVFFASLVFLCAFLTQRVVESSRWR